MKYQVTTIKDIAKALKLSPSTVSRALRDSYQISGATKKLVLDYAQKLNFKPNPIAQSLKKGKSKTIGVVVSEVANSFFAQLIDGIDTIANEQDYNVIIAQSHESLLKETANLEYLAGRSIDGLIVSVSVETKDFSFIRDLHQRGMPIVFVDRIVKEINTHKVILDNYKAAFDATCYLIKKGYKNIAAIASVAHLSITGERVAGYEAALKENKLPIIDKLIYYCNPNENIIDEVDNAVSQFMHQKKSVDAIIGLSDKLTSGALRILKNKKIKVPKQVALLGFSNTDLTELFSPALSVIKQPAFEMGKTATQLLFQLIESKRPVTHFETKVFMPELIIRDSC